MAPHRPFLFALMLPGCSTGGGGLEGAWAGNCTIDAGDFYEPVPVDVDIAEDQGDALVGSGGFEFDGERWEGPIDGARYGDIVEISLGGETQGDTATQGYGVLLEIDAIVDGREIAGDCTVAGLSGDVALER